ncbi:hypothetical protein OU994_28265 [Pseudoduganella sp. SL102]|uniref:immunity protein Imm33 domain-containing protein n=1 Tax=Pseudoduganella sp. SL102 TaxID=2995154 RepID=UPI00248C4DBD|nr:hypothetical protein [Pseudoduganella sp. SL102]WBS02105.1 hypothetical protein OU994_28265 [Pseudoduganella sp. SL102]
MTDTRHGQELAKIQQQICEKFGSPVNFPDADSKMGIAIETLSQMPITATRVHPANGTNGWYIYGGEYSDAPDFYKPVHLSHVSDILPQVLPYLALAPGFKFFVDDEGYEDVWYEPEALKGHD